MSSYDPPVDYDPTYGIDVNAVCRDCQRLLANYLPSYCCDGGGSGLIWRMCGCDGLDGGDPVCTDCDGEYQLADD